MHFFCLYFFFLSLSPCGGIEGFMRWARYSTAFRGSCFFIVLHDQRLFFAGLNIISTTSFASLHNYPERQPAAVDLFNYLQLFSLYGYYVIIILIHFGLYLVILRLSIVCVCTIVLKLHRIRETTHQLVFTEIIDFSCMGRIT